MITNVKTIKLLRRNYFTFHEFVKNSLYSENDLKLFNKLKNILSLNNTKAHKQKRIEKLINVYLISKEEGKIEVNPL